MGFLKNLFTLKTSNQLYIEEREARRVASIRERVTGFDSFLDVRRKEDDALRAKVEGFLGDIVSHFERGGAGDFLTKQYNPKSQFEDLKGGVRRMGIKWSAKADDLDIMLGFVFVEKQGEVRVDYLFEMGVLFARHYVHTKTPTVRMVPNDKFHGDGDHAIKAQGMVHDDFRSMRRYETYQDFQDDKSGPPAWFVTMLKTHVQPIP